MKDDKKLASEIVSLLGAEGLLAMNQREGLEELLGGRHNSYGNAVILRVRDEYEVIIHYQSKEVFIQGLSGFKAYWEVFDDKSQINRAVLLCILESVK